MTRKETPPILVRVATEKGAGTAVLGDVARHKVFNRTTQLFLVCDSEGRAEGLRAADVIFDCLDQQMSEAIEAGEGNPAEILDQALQTANRQLFEAWGRGGSGEPGLSCVAAFLVRTALYVAHVGDCRLYLFRKGKLLLRTLDHTEARDMVEKLEITPQEAAAHPARFRPTRRIGGAERLAAEIRPQPIMLVEGDRVLLCTDGIHDAIEEQRLSKLVAGDNPMGVPDRLTEAAGLTRGADDRTAVLIAAIDLAAAADDGDDLSSLAPAARVKEVFTPPMSPRLQPGGEPTTALVVGEPQDASGPEPPPHPRSQTVGDEGVSPDEGTSLYEPAPPRKAWPFRLRKTEVAIVAAVGILALLTLLYFALDEPENPDVFIQAPAGEGAKTPEAPKDVAAEPPVAKDVSLEPPADIRSPEPPADVNVQPTESKKQEGKGDRIDGAGWAEKACLMAGGTARQCTCYAGCNNALKEALKTLDLSVWSEDCGDAIRQGGSAYNNCQITDLCYGFKMVESEWADAQAKIGKKCADLEAAYWKERCDQAFGRIRDAVIQDLVSCDDYRNRLTEAKTSCDRAKRSTSEQAAAIERQCLTVARTACRSAVADYGALLARLDADLKANRKKPALKADVCEAFARTPLKDSAGTACARTGADPADVKTLETSKRKAEELCRPPAPPTPPLPCPELCRKRANEVLGSASKTNRQTCLNGETRLMPGGDAYEACRACGMESPGGLFWTYKQRLIEKCNKLTVDRKTDDGKKKGPDAGTRKKEPEPKKDPGFDENLL